MAGCGDMKIQQSEDVEILGSKNVGIPGSEDPKM